MNLALADYIIMGAIALVIFYGYNQIYFWCQRNSKKTTRKLLTFFDSWFGYHPGWVWVYGLLHYLAVFLLISVVKDWRHFGYMMFSFILLIGIHTFFFLGFPVKVPDSWRKQVKGRNLSEHFLRWIQKYDKPNNCFPSGHISSAMLTAMHFYSTMPQIGPWAFMFPILASLSTFYTKQHYFVDAVGGIIVGFGVFKIFTLLY